MSRYTGWLVVAALALAVGAWAYFNLERVSQRTYVGFHGEAARNPLLALQRLVERMGVNAKTVTGFTDLDSVEPGAALFLAAERRGMNALRAQHLARWVADGGHLIVEAEDPDERDVLLSALAVSRREVKTGSSGPVDIRLPDDPSPYRVDMPGHMDLADLDRRDAYAPRRDGGTLMLDFALGRGHVTVLPSFDFLDNESIGEHDHAAFAWDLLRLGPRPAIVLIAPRIERPSLLGWLADEAVSPLVALAALLALALWRSSVRFGPSLTAAEDAGSDAAPRLTRAHRRRLLDHLRASGQYLWSVSAAAQLLAAAREVCLAKIARSRPALAELPPAERIERFAQLAEITPAEVDHALNGEPQSARGFTAAVRTLQQIEEKLTRRASA